MYTAGAIIYWCFSTADLQPWAVEEQECEKKNKDVEINSNDRNFSMEAIKTKL